LLFAHLVVVTKYRRRCLTEPMLTDLETLWRGILTDLGGRLVECNGEADHVHLLLLHPPSVSLSDVARRLKGASSRVLRQRYSAARRISRGHLWTPSYFVVSCGGAPLAVVRRYIEAQARPTLLSPG
jgi:putative transposase